MLLWPFHQYEEIKYLPRNRNFRPRNLDPQVVSVTNNTDLSAKNQVMRCILNLSLLLSLMVYHIQCTNQGILITDSEAKSWYQDDTAPDTFKPSNAHDNDYGTYYSVKDRDTNGNFLNLYFSEINSIYEVKITNRLDTCCSGRIKNTALYVYFKDDEDNEKEVELCGTITGMITLKWKLKLSPLYH